MRKLAWEVCDCGCKGYDLFIGPFHYWRYVNVDKSLHVLDVQVTRNGQGLLGESVGHYKSVAEADAAVRNDLSEQIQPIVEFIK
jgi:hypothetical protein